MMKLALVIVLLVPLIAVVCGQQPELARRRDEPVRQLQSLLASNEQWFLRTIDEVLNLSRRGAESNRNSTLVKGAFEKFFQNLFAEFPIKQLNKSPTSSPTSPTAKSTTTRSSATSTPAPTTADPIRQIGRSLQNIGAVLGSSSVQLIETPIKVLDSLVTTGANLTRAGALGLDQAAKGLVSGAKLDGRPARKGERRREEQFRDQMDDDLQYYEFAHPYEPYAYRRPKYFSRECPFRFACEVGKLLQPLTYPASKAFETNRFIQDLHNRYTRAMTYGNIRGDCERYYCVLVKMLGGPVGFASGVAEIVNRIINSDLYNDYESNTRKRFHRFPQFLRSRWFRQADEEESDFWDS